MRKLLGWGVCFALLLFGFAFFVWFPGSVAWTDEEGVVSVEENPFFNKATGYPEYDVYVKDSALALFIPWPNRDGSDMRTGLISFGVKEPGGEISEGDVTAEARTPKNQSTQKINSRSYSSGIQAALGRHRDEKGRLMFAVADFENGGMYLHRGWVNMNGEVEDFVSETIGNNSDVRGVDMLAWDVNGDGVDDFIVAEYQKIDDKYKKSYYIDVFDGSTGKRGYRTEIELGVTWTATDATNLRLGVGDFYGDGKYELVVAYTGLSGKDELGDYRLALFGFNSPSFTLTDNSAKLGEDLRKIIPANKDYEGLGLAVGKFSGISKNNKVVPTPRDEIMLVGRERYSDNAKIRHYYYDPVKGGWQSPSDKIYDTGQNLSNSEFGARASAYDLDHDGRDEFVWLAPTGDAEITMGLVKLNLPADGGKIVKLGDNIKIEHNFENEDGHDTMSTTSLAAGSFMGRTRAGKTGMAAGEVLLLRNASSKNTSYLNLYTPELEGGKVVKLKRVAATALQKEGDFSKMSPVLLAGNVTGESLRLGEPTLISESLELVPTTILQMPPKHYDTLSGTLTGGESALVNSVFISYYSANTSEKNANMSQTTSFKQDSGYMAGGHVRINNRFQFDLAAQAGENWFSETDSTLGLSAKSTARIEAAYGDVIIAMTEGVRTWRYPILGERVQDGDSGLYVVASYDAVVPVEPTENNILDAASAPWYNPVHEPYNVLSYPSILEYTHDYNSDRLITSVNKYSFNGGKVATGVTWTKSQAESNTEGSSVNFEGSISAGFARKTVFDGNGDPKFLAEATAEGHYSEEERSTLKTAFDDTKGLEVDKPDVHVVTNLGLYDHTVATAAYKLPSGAMNLVFANDLKPSELALYTIWNDPKAIYYRLPDAALNLPFKFVEHAIILNTYGEAATMIPSKDDRNALLMRGVRVMNKNRAEYGLGIGFVPREAGTSIIQFPVYNYSTGTEIKSLGVKVSIIKADASLGLVYPDDPGANIVKTYNGVVDSIPYHDKKNRNWKNVEVLLDATLLADGNYIMFVELDPDNKISETHKKWDYTSDPNGNNIGYYKLAVANYFGDATLSARSKAGSEMRMDTRVPTWTLPKLKFNVPNKPDLTPIKIRDAITNGSDIIFELEIYYDEGPDFVPGFVAYTYLKPDDGSPNIGISGATIPGLAKGVRYKVDVSMRKLLSAAAADKRGTIKTVLVKSVRDWDTREIEIANIGFNKSAGNSSSSSSGGCNFLGSDVLGLLTLLVGAAMVRMRRR